MPVEQFSLTWDNFHKNMSSGLQTLLQSEALVDVTLAVEGQYIKAHKMMLSVCSPYFQTLFEVNPCKHPIVLMKDVTYSAMNSLMQFMYFGEVQVNQDDLALFIKTAEALQIKGLTGASENTESEILNIPIKREYVPQKIARNSTISPQQAKKKAVFTPPAKRHKPNPASLLPKKQTPETSLQVPQLNAEALADDFKSDEVDEGDDLPDSGDYGGDENEDMEDFNMPQGGVDMEQGQPGTSGGEDANQELSFVRSQKGFPQLMYRSYRYRMDKRKVNRTLWRCVVRKCKARCVTKSNRTTIVQSEHCHPPEVDQSRESLVPNEYVQTFMEAYSGSVHHMPFLTVADVDAPTSL